MLSRSQNAIFRPLVKLAWQVYCDQNVLDPHDAIAHDKWYRNQLITSIGCWTTKEIASAKDFGRVMLCFATIAGDEQMIARFVNDDERRAIYRLKQLMNLMDVDWAYVKGVIYQSRAAINIDQESDLEQVPATVILSIYKMLDTHFRRRKAAPVKEEESYVPF